MLLVSSYVCRRFVDRFFMINQSQIDSTFYVATNKIFIQTLIVIDFVAKNARRETWIRKILFLKKFMKQRKKKRFEKKKEYFRNSKTIFSSRQLHRDFREYCAMNRKYQLNFLSTKINFINRRFWAIDETRHRWECLWCFDSFFQTFSLRHHDRFSLFRQEEEARRRLESYSFEERVELESSREERKKEKEDEDEEREEEERKERREREREKEWCFRRADRCKQAASDASSRSVAKK